MSRPVHMTCTRNTRDSIMKECVEEFLRHHPEMRGMKITQSFMLEKLRLFYLEQGH